VTDGLVEGLNLLWLQVADDGVDGGQQLVYEGHHLSHLTKNMLSNKEANPKCRRYTMSLGCIAKGYGKSELKCQCFLLQVPFSVVFVGQQNQCGGHKQLISVGGRFKPAFAK
jgi:hypothetical protein